jgi:hypothetical protein
MTTGSVTSLGRTSHSLSAGDLPVFNSDEAIGGPGRWAAGSVNTGGGRLRNARGASRPRSSTGVGGRLARRGRRLPLRHQGSWSIPSSRCRTRSPSAWARRGELGQRRQQHPAPTGGGLIERLAGGLRGLRRRGAPRAREKRSSPSGLFGGRRRDPRPRWHPGLGDASRERGHHSRVVRRFGERVLNT